MGGHIDLPEKQDGGWSLYGIAAGRDNMRTSTKTKESFKDLMRVALAARKEHLRPKRKRKQKGGMFFNFLGLLGRYNKPNVSLKTRRTLGYILRAALKGRKEYQRLKRAGKQKGGGASLFEFLGIADRYGRIKRISPKTKQTLTDVLRAAIKGGVEYQRLKRARKQKGGTMQPFSAKGKGHANNTRKHYVEPFLENYSVYNVLAEPKIYPSKLRKAVAQNLSRKQLNALNKSLTAILRKKIRVDNQAKAALYPHLNKLKTFYGSKNSPKAQRTFLQKQSGGFLPFLIPIITGVLTSAVAEGASAGISAAIKAKKRKKHHHH